MVIGNPDWLNSLGEARLLAQAVQQLGIDFAAQLIHPPLALLPFVLQGCRGGLRLLVARVALAAGEEHGYRFQYRSTRM